MLRSFRNLRVLRNLRGEIPLSLILTRIKNIPQSVAEEIEA